MAKLLAIGAAGRLRQRWLQLGGLSLVFCMNVGSAERIFL